MKKIVFIFCLFLFPLTVFAQGQDQSNKKIIDIEKSIQQIQSDISDVNIVREEDIKAIEEKLSYQQQLTQASFNSISTSLSASSFNLGVFGVGMAFLVIIIGVYITLIERKVRGIYEKNKNLLTSHEKIKDDIEELNKIITNKLITELYAKIQKEETRHLLNRLNFVPEDISNINNLLYSREITSEFYNLFKSAYIKGKQKNIEPGFIYSYRTLFFQHFPYQIIGDEEIYNDIESSYNSNMNSSFENDILKTTDCIIKYFIDYGLTRNKDKIISYAKAIISSKHSEFNKLYETIFNRLTSKELRFDFYNILLDGDDLELFISKFGSILLRKYQDEENLDSEKNILEQIDKKKRATAN